VPINIAIYGIFSASITNSSAKLPKILNGHMQRLYDALCLICLIHQNVVNSLNSPYFLDYLSHSTHVMIAPEGVSSFGFGGTNGRCDIWGAARWVG